MWLLENCYETFGDRDITCLSLRFDEVPFWIEKMKKAGLEVIEK